MTDDPTPDLPPDRPADKTLTWWPLLGALIVAVVVGALVFVIGAGDNNNVGSETDTNGALVCPRTYTRTNGNGNDRVPANPSGVAGKVALVPDAAPSHVTLCRYGPPDGLARPNEQIPFRDRVVLKAGLAAATHELSAARKASGDVSCTPQKTADRAAYLVGFTFATGVLWVSVPGDDCARTSNGQFATTSDYRGSIAKAFATKSWPTT